MPVGAICDAVDGRAERIMPLKRRSVVSVRSRKSVTSRCTTRALVVLLAMANPVAAQVVRGTVTERGSGESLPGVLISLEPTVGGDAAARSVLSDATGAYAVRGTAGSYRLTAKRIGVQRFFSEPFTLAAGETREIGIEMEALVFVLPPVRIVDAGLCVLRDAERRSEVKELVLDPP